MTELHALHGLSNDMAAIKMIVSISL